MELSRVTPFTVEFGAGQSSRNLGIVAAVFDALAQSDVNEQVIPCDVYIYHMHSGCVEFIALKREGAN